MERYFAPSFFISQLATVCRVLGFLLARFELLSGVFKTSTVNHLRIVSIKLTAEKTICSTFG